MVTKPPPILVATSLRGSIVSSEYYRRELDLVFAEIDPSDVSAFESLRTRFILISDFSEWELVLRKAQKKSLVVLLTGNENYDVSFFRKIDDYESIRCAFVEYLPNKKIKLPIIFIWKFIKNDFSVLTRKEFYFFLLRSIKTLRLISRVRLETPFYFLPIGYTDRFYRELLALKVINTCESLFSNFNEITSKKHQHPFFYGQKGSWLRRRIMSKFQDLHQSDVSSYPGWGGSGNSSNSRYALGLIESAFVICPPGNRSNETNRYYESIACNAIPIISTSTIQDLMDFDYWPSHTNFKTKTIDEIYEYLRELSDEERHELLWVIRKNEYLKFLTLKQNLRKLASELS